MKAKMSIVLFFLISSFVSLSFYQFKTGSLHVEVFDATTEECISGAGLEFKDYRTTKYGLTNAEGSFLFSNCIVGIDTLNVSYVGYYQVELHPFIYENTTTYSLVLLTPASEY